MVNVCDHCQQPVVRASDIVDHRNVQTGKWPNDWIHTSGWWTCPGGGAATVNGSQHAPDTPQGEPMNPDPPTTETCLRQAINIIADALLEEANERDWCSEYNEFVDNVNRRLPAGVPQLQKTASERRFTFEATISDDHLSGLETAIDEYLADQGLSACTGFDWS